MEIEATVDNNNSEQEIQSKDSQMSVVGELVSANDDHNKAKKNSRRNSLHDLQAFLKNITSKKKEKKNDSVTPKSNSSKKKIMSFGSGYIPNYREEANLDRKKKLERVHFAKRFHVSFGFKTESCMEALRRADHDIMKSVNYLLKWYPKGSSVTNMIFTNAKVIIRTEEKLHAVLQNIRYTMSEGTVKERLKAVMVHFEECDTGNKEYLTPQEFDKLAQTLGITLSEAELKEAILKIDEDGNGQIEVDEFLEWWGEDDLIEEYERQEREGDKGLSIDIASPAMKRVRSEGSAPMSPLTSLTLEWTTKLNEKTFSSKQAWEDENSKSKSPSSGFRDVNDVGHFTKDDRRATFTSLDSLQKSALGSLGSARQRYGFTGNYSLGQKRHTYHYPHKINQRMVQISQSVNRQNRRPSISSQIAETIKDFDKLRKSRQI